MNALDANVLMNIFVNLSGEDVENLCKTSQKLNTFCNKYNDLIWKNKLLKNYGIQERDIIGTPRSLYLGLEQDKGLWYFYDIFDSIIEILEYVGTKPLEYDTCFKVPGIESLKGEKIVWANANLSVYGFGNVDLNIVGKRPEKVLDDLIKKIEYDYLDLEQKTIEEIKAIKIGQKYEYDVEAEWNIRRYELTIQLFELSLP